ncbi:MAG: hypothetical protein R6U98_20320 [Pirellulaceae bacterium]
MLERQLSLGGQLQTTPPRDMAEMNAEEWTAWAQSATGAAEDDTSNKVAGEASLKFVTDGGFDTFVRYPGGFTALWNVTAAEHLNVSFMADNDNLGFQNGSPWIRLRGTDGSYYEYQYYANNNPSDVLNQAIGQWQSYQIPLNAPSDAANGWRRTAHGTPDLAAIQAVEIHADTWGSGFTLWVDGLGFDLPGIVERHVFYNNSVFDGNDGAAGEEDDEAICSDKAALRPGETASFANYTNYSRGINGLMIDIEGVPEAVTRAATDFQFKVGNSNSPEEWAAAPLPVEITLRPGAGVSGSDRVTLIWKDNILEKQGLEVTLLSDANGGHLGLDENDVFYFGNAIGETGDSPFDAMVDQDDVNAIGANTTAEAGLTNRHDIDRDGDVDDADAALAADHATTPETRLVLLGQDPPPSVTAVYVRSSKWDMVFCDWMHSEGMADADGYYQVPTDENQLDTLPWSGLTDVRLVFSEDVDVESGDLMLIGTDAGNVTATGFDYDTDTWTATWTLDSLEADKFLLALSDTVTATDSGLPLDGEHADGGGQPVSGDTVPGGDFQFRFDVLPGDATDSGNVVASDVSVLASAFGSFASGDGDRYSIFVDYDGSGNVVAADVSILASHFGQFLPGAEPALPETGNVTATSGVMSSASGSQTVECSPARPEPTSSEGFAPAADVVPCGSDSDAAVGPPLPHSMTANAAASPPVPPVPRTPVAVVVNSQVQQPPDVQSTSVGPWRPGDREFEFSDCAGGTWQVSGAGRVLATGHDTSSSKTIPGIVAGRADGNVSVSDAVAIPGIHVNAMTGVRPLLSAGVDEICKSLISSTLCL